MVLRITFTNFALTLYFIIEITIAEPQIEKLIPRPREGFGLGLDPKGSGFTCPPSFDSFGLDICFRYMEKYFFEIGNIYLNFHSLLILDSSFPHLLLNLCDQ